MPCTPQRRLETAEGKNGSADPRLVAFLPIGLAAQEVSYLHLLEAKSCFVVRREDARTPIELQR